jgi:lysylphosphatidylglycerol synthetase-like protein (DUF2156 family)
MERILNTILFLFVMIVFLSKKVFQRKKSLSEIFLSVNFSSSSLRTAGALLIIKTGGTDPREIYEQFCSQQEKRRRAAPENGETWDI